MPFDFLTLLACNGERKTASHGVFQVRGIIDPDMEAKYLRYATDEITIEITVTDNTAKEKVLMKGIVTDLDISTTNGVKVLWAEITTRTLLMDMSEHLRTFQSSGISYNQIVESIAGTYPSGDAVLALGEGRAIPHLLVQYKETDWEFLSRLASHFGTALIPHFGSDGIEFWFGLPQPRHIYTINRSHYGIKSSFKDKTLCYSIRERDVYDIGDMIILNGLETKVCEIKTEYAGGELYHTYSLLVGDSLNTPLYHNAKIIGASLHSYVTHVEKDVVQVAVNGDENGAFAGKRSFPYATVYSSADGTGWYCMPEPGDGVRLYFPGENEKNAYVASSTHLASAAGDERINPDFKSLMNKHNKEILFTPKSLILTNNAGMSIEILDDVGIRIVSNKAISITSADTLSVVSTASTIRLTAKESIIMKQGDTAVTLSELAAMSGSQVRIE